MADTIGITRTCPGCHAVQTVTVNAKGWAAWDEGRGAYLQDAFPELDDATRETILTGLCRSCSNVMFAGLDDVRSGVLIIMSGDSDDIELIAQAEGYRGAERPAEDDRCDDEPTPDLIVPDRTPDANPGGSGVTGVVVDDLAANALVGLTAQGGPATRGHLTAPSLDWPRCAAEIPGLSSPIFRQVQPNICNRPATLLMAFSASYVDSMSDHRCDDDDCPIADLAADPHTRHHMLQAHTPVCGMHLPALRKTEAEWLAQVGAPGVDHIYELAVIGVESYDGTKAEVIDLRGLVAT